MPKLLIVVNEDRFFLSHRLAVALEAQQRGFNVTVACKDTGQSNEIKKHGIATVDLHIDPTGMNIFAELKTLNFLMRLYSREKPDIVHHVGLKNILWGGLAAKIKGVPGVINAVSGLGGLFNGDNISAVSKGILGVMAFNNARKNVRIIFQNHDDEALFLEHKVIKEDQKYFIKGSGVDLDTYAYTPEPSDKKVRVIFTARMVTEKGVMDLIEAAKLLKGKYFGKVVFMLCGRLTPNKSAVPREYLLTNCDGQYIKWLGEREDVKELLEICHIMAFPSYYREGVPKSLIEACAIGRPIITCDSVGCRDVVDDGKNGFLIPPKSPEILAEKLKQLIDSPALRKKMGEESRKIAERDFSLSIVVERHMDLYNSLLQSQG